MRGLDYSTRTVFEFETERLGAQRGLGGGGRYDGLVEELGGPATPGVGWAAGIERILLASETKFPTPPRPVFVAVDEGGARGTAFSVVTALREAGVRAEMEQTGRSMKGQMKQADRLNARAVAIVGGDLAWRDMDTGEQRPVTGVQEIVRVAVGFGT